MPGYDGPYAAVGVGPSVYAAPGRLGDRVAAVNAAPGMAVNTAPGMAVNAAPGMAVNAAPGMEMMGPTPTEAVVAPDVQLQSLIQSYQGQVGLQNMLASERQRLQLQVQQLAAEIRGVRQDISQRQAERATLGTVLTGLRQRVQRRQVLEKKGAELLQVDEKMRESTAVDSTLHNQLQAAASELQHRRNTTSALRQAIQSLHSYGVVCHEKVTELQKQVREAEVDRTHRGDILEAREQERLKPQMRLSNINEHLKERLRKAHSNIALLQRQTVQAQQEIKGLKIQSQAQAADLQSQVQSRRQEEEAAEAEFQMRLGDARQATELVTSAQAEVEDLRQRIAQGELEQLLANNTELRRRIHDVRTAIQTSRAAWANATARYKHAKVHEHAATAQLQDSLAAEQEVSKQSVEAVAKAKQEDDRLEEEAQQATLEAESLQAEDCVDIWDRRHPDVESKLEQCKQTEQDLEAAKAQVESLKNTVAAAQS